MKLKVKDLYDLSLGYGELADKELSTAISFNISRAQKIVSEELIAADKVRKKIVDKYKDKDLPDNQVQIKKDKIKQFDKEMDELMEQDVDVNINKIKLADLSDLKVKPKTFLYLDKVIDAK